MRATGGRRIGFIPLPKSIGRGRRGARKVRRSDAVKGGREEKERRELLREAYETFIEAFGGEKELDWKKIEARYANGEIPGSVEECYEVIRSMLAESEDPYTKFMTPMEMEAVKGSLEPEMEGYGIVYSLERDGWWRRRKLVVTDVVKGSPAWDVGMQRGDEVTHVNSMAIRRISKMKTMRLFKDRDIQSLVVTYMRKAPPKQSRSQKVFEWAKAKRMRRRGTRVQRISLREGTDNQAVNHRLLEHTVSLQRGQFEMPTVLFRTVPVPTIGNVAYLKVNEFANQTANQVKNALNAIRKDQPIALYVLDLRGNSGGLLDRAATLARTFLPRGRDIVSYTDFRGKSRLLTSSTGFFWGHRIVQTPLAVLVDDESASAAEQVAAALRENCRAVLIGTKTYGKGTVQVIAELPGGGGMSVTTGRYHTPKGNEIGPGQELIPDLKVKRLPDDWRVVQILFGRNCGRYDWILRTTKSCQKMTKP